MKIGYVGLGKMGKNMVLRLLAGHIDVVAWNRSPEPLLEVSAAGAIPTETFSDFVGALPAPRIIWFMITAGDAVDSILSEMVPLLKPGDLIVDGGNSWYKNSIQRAGMLRGKGIRFMDVGVSGGPEGARSGACLMAGGDRKDYEEILPLLKVIAASNAYGYVGPVGAGHFVKMVHNGIEYGMMEAIAEGTAILQRSEFNLNVAEVFRIYNSRSVIESRLVGWTAEALQDDPELVSVSSVIPHTGEADWAVEAAKELHVDIPVIDASLTVRKESETAPENFRNRVVSALRGKFGQHKVGKG